jgi:hypothetical protein
MLWFKLPYMPMLTLKIRLPALIRWLPVEATFRSPSSLAIARSRRWEVQIG